MLRAQLASVVIGGTLEAIDGDRPPPRRPLPFCISQADASARLLPRDFVPADLIAQAALEQAAIEQRQAAAGPGAAPTAVAGAGDGVAGLAAAAQAAAGEEGPLDCLEACCLQDDLHLFSPAGADRTLLTWARLPLPLLYEGSQFCYPLRQYSLAAPLRQLALNRCAAAGWDSCLWHANLPTLAARSAYSLTLLQLAPQDADERRQRQQRRQGQRQGRRAAGSVDGSGMAESSAEERSAGEEEGGEGEEEEGWEDDGGGFELQRLAVVGTRRPTAHCCWQRHLTQAPLLLLDDASLLEVKLQEGVQVAELWRPSPGTVPQRLHGVLQVQAAPQPRTVVLCLRDRLSRVDMRCRSPSLQQLWQCPQGQHLTSLCGPPPPPLLGTTAAGQAAGQPPTEHLLAAGVSTGVPGAGSQLLIFDLRKPYHPVASWQQPGMQYQLHEPLSVLRWMHAEPFAETTNPAASAAAAAGPSSSRRGGQRPQAQPEPQPRYGGVVVAACVDSGRVVGCQYTAQVSGPALLSSGGKITEQADGGGAAAALLGHLQAALQQQQQEQERQRQRQQEQGQGQNNEGEQAMEMDAQERQGSDDSGDGRQDAAQAQAQAQAVEGGGWQQQQQQQAGGAGPSSSAPAAAIPAAAAAAAAPRSPAAAQHLVPPSLRPPPPLPVPFQLLWQPAHTFAVKPLLGPPLLLLAPPGQQPVLAERLASGRLLLQRQQAAAGGAIQLSKLPLPGQQRQQVQLLGVAAAAVDWATQEALPQALLCSLTRSGDVALSVLHQRAQQAPQQTPQQQQAQQQAQLQQQAVPVLLPAARAAASSSGASSGSEGDGSGEWEGMAAARGAAGGRVGGGQAGRLPYVAGVPKALVAALAAGELSRCGCCRACRSAGRSCLTSAALSKAELLPAVPQGQRLAEERPLLTVPAGERGRSVVQLPLHVALAQLLVLEQLEQGTTAQEGGLQPASLGQQPLQQTGQLAQQQRQDQQQQHHRQQQQQQQQQQQALSAVLLHLQRGLSLQELHQALLLQRHLDAYESASSSDNSSGSSGGSEEGEGSAEEGEAAAGKDPGGGTEAAAAAHAGQAAPGSIRTRSSAREAAARAAAATQPAAEAEMADASVAAGRAAAVRQLQRQQQRLRRRLLRQWLHQRRREQRQQQQQRREALALLLTGSDAGPAAAAGGEHAAAARGARGSAAGGGGGGGGGSGVQQRWQQRQTQRKRKSAAAASGSRLEPASAALEGVLQAAGLLPLRRPRGLAAEAASEPFGAAHQGRQLRQAAAADLLPPAGGFQQQVAAAVAQLGTPPGLQLQQQKAEEMAEGEGEQHGTIEWQLRSRRFAVHGPRNTACGESAAALVAAPHIVAAGPAAAVLVPVRKQQQAAAHEGPSTSAAAAVAPPAAASGGPVVRLREAVVSGEATAVLLQLRAAWDAGSA